MVEESTDGAVTSYLYGNNIDEALQMSRKDEAYYYHTNHLGSTMGLSNKEGKIVEKVEYDVYGMPTFLNADGKVLAASTIGNNILFTGREYNAETELYYLRSRNQQPNIGRFVQFDRLLYLDGLNNYAYVRNRPMFFIDSFGTTATKKCDEVNPPQLSNSYISNPPYTGPYISSAPTREPEKTFCESHPLICEIWKQKALNGKAEMCGGLIGVACVDVGFTLDKNGLNFNGGTTIGTGVGAYASAGLNSGVN